MSEKYSPSLIEAFARTLPRERPLQWEDLHPVEREVLLDQARQVLQRLEKSDIGIHAIERTPADPEESPNLHESTYRFILRTFHDHEAEIASLKRQVARLSSLKIKVEQLETKHENVTRRYDTTEAQVRDHAKQLDLLKDHKHNLLINKGDVLKALEHGRGVGVRTALPLDHRYHGDRKE